MPAKFFTPYYDKETYHTGINGKKILVVGASFYCDKVNCPHYEDCTNTERKSSRNYDDKCWAYREDQVYRLSNEPTTAITETYGVTSYQNFEIFLQAAILKEEPWKYVAFTNYVQFMVPTKMTECWYITDDDYEALKEVIYELCPDVIITWGNPVADHIRNKQRSEKQIDEELIGNEYYLYHFEYNTKDGKKNVTFVNLYHPSALTYWSNSLRTAYKYVRKALEIDNK